MHSLAGGELGRPGHGPSEPDSEAWLLMQSEPRNTDRGMIQGSGENKYKPEAAPEKEKHRTKTLKYS